MFSQIKKRVGTRGENVSRIHACVHMCIYVYMGKIFQEFTHVYICVYMCIWRKCFQNSRMCTYVCICVYGENVSRIHACVHIVYMCICMYVYIYVCMCTCMYTYIHMYRIREHASGLRREFSLRIFFFKKKIPLASVGRRLAGHVLV